MVAALQINFALWGMIVCAACEFLQLVETILEQQKLRTNHSGTFVGDGTRTGLNCERADTE
jgi:hypothetical protein